MSDYNIKDSELPAMAALTGTEIMTGVQSGTSSRTTSAAVAALYGSPTSVGDNDLTSSNQTYDITLITALAAGSRRRVSWHSGDGTYNFSFTNTTGIYIDNVLMAAFYQGDGTGHLDLLVIDSTHLVTINRGEIWDSIRSNTAVTAWNFEKSLDGTMRQWGWTFDIGDGATSITGETARTFLVPFANEIYNPQQIYIGVKDGSDPTSRTDCSAAAFFIACCRLNSNTQMYTNSAHRDGSTIASNRRVLSVLDVVGNWITSFPKIT